MFNGSNVVKGCLVDRVSGDYFTEVSNLFVHVFQKDQAIPRAKLLNICITLSWHIYLYCASGSEGVGIYHMRYDAFFIFRWRVQML